MHLSGGSVQRAVGGVHEKSPGCVARSLDEVLSVYFVRCMNPSFRGAWALVCVCFQENLLAARGG